MPRGVPNDPEAKARRDANLAAGREVRAARKEAGLPRHAPAKLDTVRVTKPSQAAPAKPSQRPQQRRASGPRTERRDSGGGGFFSGLIDAVTDFF